MPFLTYLKEIGITGLLDIAFMSLIIYSVLVWFKKTRAAFVLTGIIIIAVVYLLARELNLFLTATVFQGFFAVILIAVVIIFQEELRHFFERVALWGLNRSRKNRIAPRLSRAEVEILVRTLNDFAREKIGALIVLQGKDLITRHLEGGLELEGKLSEPLLKSIFDPHSVGHDGAIVIEQDQITRFSCHLPLSKNFKILKQKGTRHAAALGLAELSDALCLVVSEEQGIISVARNSVIHTVKDSENLNSILENFYQEISPKPENRTWLSFFTRNSREKIIALSMAVVLWLVMVYGSKLVYKTYTVPIEYSVLSSEFTKAKISPPEVTVSLSGPQRSFYFFSKNKIKVFLKLWNLKEGKHKVNISRADVSFPKNIELENIDPPAVRVEISQEAEDRIKK